MILGSPGFYWDDTVIFKIEEMFAAARKPLHTRVFIAAGGAEQPPMIELMQRFVSDVNNRKYEGLSLESHVFDNETHMSSDAPIAARGLRVVFRDFRRSDPARGKAGADRSRTVNRTLFERGRDISTE